MPLCQATVQGHREEGEVLFWWCVEPPHLEWVRNDTIVITSREVTLLLGTREATLAGEGDVSQGSDASVKGRELSIVVKTTK